MTNIGTIEIQDLFVGSNNAVGLYFGAVEVWSKDTPQPTSPNTKVKYTSASGLPDWEGDIVGELISSSIPNKGRAEEVEIGSHVTSIGQSALFDCTKLTSVTIPNSVTEIGKQSFKSCENLNNVTIPNSVTIIWNEAFSNCEKLTNISLGNSITTIQNYAFSRCYALPSLTIPGSVTSIGTSIFYDCNLLKNVTVDNKTISTVQGMTNYPWGLKSGAKIHCTDGDITL